MDWKPGQRVHVIDTDIEGTLGLPSSRRRQYDFGSGSAQNTDVWPVLLVGGKEVRFYVHSALRRVDVDNQM